MEFRTTCKGISVFATQCYNVGDIILVEEAYSFVTLQDTSSNICHNCFRSSHPLKICSQCKFARYCGLECQRKAWNQSNHRWECKAIASLHQKKIPSIVRLTALVLFHALSSNKKDEFLLERCRCYPYVCSTVVDDRLDYLVEELRCLIRLTSYPEKNSLELFEDTFLASLIRMLEMNAHTIFNSELNTLGVGFFPTASYMNHDCRPNCVALFTGGFQRISNVPISIQIRCIRPVEAGEEIVISYLDVCLSWMDRSEWLLEHYMFTCCCPRCKEESSLTFQQYNEKWNDLKYNWKAINQLIARSVREEERNSNILSSFESMEMAWINCQKCIKTYPNSQILEWKQIEIASRLGYLCIVLEKFSQAIEYLECYMDFIKKEPAFAYLPTVALEMLKLGKLYAYLGNLTGANHYLEKAKQIYSKILVKEDPIYRTCEEELYKIRMEHEMVANQIGPRS